MRKNVPSHHYFPAGFLTVFGSELSARFSFWAVQSIIVLYLINKFLLSDSQSYAISASYEALSYAATFLGGYCADKYFGALRILMIGILLSALGSLLLAIGHLNLIYLGLAFLVVGMGFYMPTNATLVDHLYEKNDPSRARGFFYFYMATNIGSLAGPLFFGFLFEYSHALSFLGLALLLGAFFIANYVTARGVTYLRVNPEHLTVSFRKVFSLFLIVLVGILLCVILIAHKDLTRDLLFVVGIFATFWILMKSREYTPYLKKKIFLAMFFSVVSLFFFAMEFQIVNSIITFTRDFVNKNLFSLQIPTSSFVSFEPLGVICMAPVVDYFFERYIGKDSLGITFKSFAISFLFLSASFLVLIIPTKLFMIDGHKINACWLFLSQFLMGTGEVLMMPTLLALVTKDIPESLQNTMVGFLYLCIAFSSYLAGVVATCTQSFASTTFSPILGYYNTYIGIFLFLLGLSVLLYLSGCWVKDNL